VRYAPEEIHVARRMAVVVIVYALFFVVDVVSITGCADNTRNKLVIYT